MMLFQPLLLTHSTEIQASPEKIWNFFVHLEQNYVTWHPEDHIVFKWTKGKPMETGAGWYAEEAVKEKTYKLKGSIGEVIPYRKIEFKCAFPISLAAPKFVWIFESKGTCTVFTAISYLRAGELMCKLAKKHMKENIAMHNKHVSEEGENLKRILEREGT